MIPEETYPCVDDRACVACATLRLRISELELTVDAMRQQAQRAAEDETRRITSMQHIKSIAETALK